MYFPVIATINLGSQTVLDFYNIEKREAIAFSLYLEPRSLLIQHGDVYGNYMHGSIFFFPNSFKSQSKFNYGSMCLNRNPRERRRHDW